MFDSVGRCASGLAIVAVFACFAPHAHAQRTVLESDVREGFAGPVALVADTAFVGVPGRERGAAGEVLVFTRTDGTWRLAQRIASPAGTSSTGNFGACLAARGDALVVGAPALRAGAVERGEAYLFERSGTPWMLTADAIARPADLVRYGSSVAISDRWIAVGAPGNDSFSVRGTVVVFDRTGVEPARLLEADAVSTLLGARVAAAGDAILASQPETGTVLVYRYGTSWELTDTLAQPGGDGVAWRFGASIALAAVGGDLRALIGAPLAETADGAVGGVFAFDRVAGAWPAVGGSAVELEGRAQSDATGQAIALSEDGSLAAIGAPLAEQGATMNVGRVHLLTRRGDGWSVLGSLAVSGAPADEQLGSFVALDGDDVLAGAPNALDRMGYVAVFDVPDPLGAACSAASSCGSGRCVDEVCCESDCAAECMRCDGTGACVADDEGASCASACGVAGATGVCGATGCEPSVGECPDAGAASMSDASLALDAGPRGRVSGCRCEVHRASARGAWAVVVLSIPTLGLALSRRIRRRRRS